MLHVEHCLLEQPPEHFTTALLSPPHRSACSRQHTRMMGAGAARLAPHECRCCAGALTGPARAQGHVPWDTFVNTLLPSGQVFVGVATRNWPAPNSVLSGQLLPGTLAGRCAPPRRSLPSTCVGASLWC